MKVPETLKDIVKSKSFRVVMILLAALVLLLVCYRVFAAGKEEDAYKMSTEEARLVALLEKLDGVDDATVMITEEEGTAVGAVVLFQGEDGLILRMNILEIAAGALNIPKNAVRVYPVKG